MGIQIIWVAHTWSLLAMCAILKGSIHRKMTDVCATIERRLSTQFLDTTLEEGRRRAELVKASNEEEFREGGTKRQEAQLPFPSWLTFRLRIMAGHLSRTANLRASR